MRKITTLSALQVAQIHFWFSYRSFNFDEIAKKLKLPKELVLKTLEDNRTQWIADRRTLPLAERLSALDEAELEATERIYEIQKIAQIKLFEFFLNCTPEQAVAMYKVIPSIKEQQTVQRIMSNRPTLIENFSGNIESLVTQLNVKEEEIALSIDANKNNKGAN